MLTQVLPAATAIATAPRASPTPCLWTHLVQTGPAAGAHVANRPGRRAGRQVTSHVSPRPGQTPTSRPALGNYLPSPFPTGAPSFPYTAQGNGGVVPLISHLPSSCSAYYLSLSPWETETHTHTHTHTHTQ